MLSINASELVWTIINFFLLFFLLKRFLFNPISDFMEQRQARIDAGLEAERQAKTALEENARELSEQKAEARREAAAFLNESETEDARRAAAAYAEARDAAAAFQRTGEESLQQRQARETEELTAKTPELAALLAAHLLGEE